MTNHNHRHPGLDGHSKTRQVPLYNGLHIIVDAKPFNTGIFEGGTVVREVLRRGDEVRPRKALNRRGTHTTNEGRVVSIGAAPYRSPVAGVHRGCEIGIHASPPELASCSFCDASGLLWVRSNPDLRGGRAALVPKGCSAPLHPHSTATNRGMAGAVAIERRCREPVGSFVCSSDLMLEPKSRTPPMFRSRIIFSM